MDAFEQLRLASQSLNEALRKEQQLPDDVAKLKSAVLQLQKIVVAILETLPEEQRSKVNEKLRGKSE